MSKTVETTDYAAFAKRIVRAYARRVGEGDDADLGEMLEVAEVLDDAITDAVRGLRDQGHSWAYVAEGAGITRQSAWERWAHRVD